MADEPAGVGIVKRYGGKAEFPDFAEIVEQGPGHQQVAVQRRVMLRDMLRQAGYAQGMFQQAAEIGMMHHFGCRRHAELFQQFALEY